MHASTQPASIRLHQEDDRNFSSGNPRTPATALRDAIRNHELQVYYQPRHCVDSGNVEIVEALVRWRKPGAGLLHPEAFIDTAIEHGLVFEMDLWVFTQCCKDLTWLRKHYGGQLKIAVNITASECESIFHTNQLIKVCHAYGLQLSDFEFEITETVNMKKCQKVAAFCTTFTQLGANICLDDFGTGYSPLSNLCELNIDIIKIDKSFVKNMETSNRFKVLVKHMIDIAHEMKLKIVAEGIETAAQYNCLREMGCHQLQGYHISHPLPAKMLLPFLVTL